MTSYSWSSVTSASSKLRKLSTACLPRWDSRGWPFPGIVSLLRDLRLGASAIKCCYAVLEC